MWQVVLLLVAVAVGLAVAMRMDAWLVDGGRSASAPETSDEQEQRPT